MVMNKALWEIVGQMAVCINRNFDDGCYASCQTAGKTHCSRHLLIFKIKGCWWLQLHTDVVLIPFWQEAELHMLVSLSLFSALSVQPSSREIIMVLGLSLHRGDLGLQAEERSVRPVAEELEVLKELVAGLQHIKLIGELRGEGRGCRSQPWRFNSQHL